jgi:hypothetical protein
MEAYGPGTSKDRSRWIRLVLAVAFAAAPFGAGLIRFIQTGSDVRYFWVAFAAFLGALVVMLIGRASTQPRKVVRRLSIIAFFVSTLLAVLAARMLGARAMFGIWAVAIVFALFFTASQLLYAHSRPRES